MSRSNSVPNYVLPTYKMLECAFPFGIAEEQLMPLLKALHKNMSFENITLVVSHFTGRSDIEIGKLVINAQTEYSDNDERVKKLIEVLEPCGYADWLLLP